MDSILDEIANPAAKEEEVLESDSDAVVSIFQPELV
eukprot:SAG22_NODE_13946_length_390_cov_0.670103_1_plen_35_part_01